MSLKNYYGKIKNNFKGKKSYGYNKSKSNYNKLAKKILVSIIIVILIILLKKIDIKPTNRVIEIINNTVNYNYDIKDGSKKVVNFAKGLKDWPNKIKSVFGDNETKKVGKYAIPIEGKIYQKFGEEKKNNGVTLFHRGIDIIASDYSVCSIGDGVVIEIGTNKIYGKYIIIEHEEINSVYCNMDKIFLKKGDNVSVKQKIGTLINLEDGKNIFHFQVWKEGTPIDPLTILGNQYSKSKI